MGSQVSHKVHCRLAQQDIIVHLTFHWWPLYLHPVPWHPQPCTGLPPTGSETNKWQQNDHLEQLQASSTFVVAYRDIPEYYYIYNYITAITEFGSNWTTPEKTSTVQLTFNLSVAIDDLSTTCRMTSVQVPDAQACTSTRWVSTLSLCTYGGHASTRTNIPIWKSSTGGMCPIRLPPRLNSTHWHQHFLQARNEPHWYIMDMWQIAIYSYIQHAT